MAEPMHVNMHEAKTHLSRLVERVEAGEEIVLDRAGKPVARLVALRPATGSRTPGALRGRIRISDDFDAPLPGEIAAAFAGERP
jgi:prevent-host-death family protein